MGLIRQSKYLFGLKEAADRVDAVAGAVAHCGPVRKSGPVTSCAVKFAVDLYGAFPVKRLFWVVLRVFCSEREEAVFRPVACNQVPGARGRGQGTETLAELGGLPPSVACVSVP